MRPELPAAMSHYVHSNKIINQLNLFTNLSLTPQEILMESLTTQWKSSDAR